MNNSDDWIKDELLQLFYSAVEDFRSGTIDEEVFREKLLKLANRYERTFVEKDKGSNQRDLF